MNSIDTFPTDLLALTEAKVKVRVEAFLLNVALNPPLKADLEYHQEKNVGGSVVAKGESLHNARISFGTLLELLQGQFLVVILVHL